VPEPTPAVQAQLLTYVAAQAAARQRIQDTVLTQLVALLRALLTGRWYDEPAIAAAVPQLDAVVRQGQDITRDITRTYLDQSLMALDATPPRVDPELPARLRAVDVFAEWERPAEQYRYARSQGADDAQATLVAVERAQHLAVEDLDLAMRETTRRHLAAAEDVTGYRRVIHPELSKSGTCGLCVAAADRVYHVDDLMPSTPAATASPCPSSAGGVTRRGSSTARTPPSCTARPRRGWVDGGGQAEEHADPGVRARGAGPGAA
jgi:hypothetical protein